MTNVLRRGLKARWRVAVEVAAGSALNNWARAAYY
jgi:hypothetical protein